MSTPAPEYVIDVHGLNKHFGDKHVVNDVSLQVARGGFYESLEISDLLSLLAVLDNPLQDLPLPIVTPSPVMPCPTL